MRPVLTDSQRAATSTPLGRPRTTPALAALLLALAAAGVVHAQNKPNDPFGGVDPNSNDVLKRIMQMDAEKANKKRPPAPAAPATAPAPAAAPAAPAARTAAPAASPAAPATPAAATPQRQTVSAPAQTAAPAAPAAAVVAPAAAAAAASAAARPTPPAEDPVAALAKPTAEVDEIVLRPIARPQPRFPTSAARDGVANGRVVATLEVGTDGKVTNVTVTASTPSRDFARAAMTALRDWQYEPIPRPTTVNVEIEFVLR